MFLSAGNVDWGYKCEQKNKVYKRKERRISIDILCCFI